MIKAILSKHGALVFLLIALAFSGTNLMGSSFLIFKILVALALGWMIFYFLLGRVTLTVPQSPEFFFIVCLLFCWLLLTILYTVYPLWGVNTSLQETLKMISLFCAFLFFVLLSLDSTDYDILIKTYSYIFFIFSLLGIIGTILYMFKMLPTVHTTTIGVRSFYYLLFTWTTCSSGHLSYVNIIKSLPFIRLQSFYYEPGTFALLLYPAIFYFWKSAKIKASILLFALLLTLSVGAILPFLFVVMLRVRKTILKELLTFKGFVIFICLLLLFLVFHNFIIHYIVDKFGIGMSSHAYTSYSVKKTYVDNLISLLASKPYMGIGWNQSAMIKAFHEVVTARIFSYFYRGGIIGGLLLIGFILSVTYYSIKVIIKDVGHHSLFIGGLGLSLMSFGFMRETFFDTYFMLFLTAIVIRYYEIYLWKPKSPLSCEMFSESK